MSYFGQRPMGDPGFFGTLFDIGKRAAPLVGGLIGGPVGASIGTAVSRIGGAVTKRVPAVAVGATVAREVFGGAPPGMTKVPGVRGIVQRTLPGGATGFVEVRRRRRTNFANPKALNRAISRVSGFARLVQRSKKSIAKANTAINPSRGRSRAAPRGGTHAH